MEEFCQEGMKDFVLKARKAVAFGKLRNLSQNVRNIRKGVQMSEPMKFYCAGAIRGELFDKGYFDKVIKIVKEFGEPQTEKIGYKLYPLTRYADPNEQTTRERVVAERDRKWIRQCSAVIAEFSGPSTGTGWEICYATRLHRKPTLCLYHVTSVPSLMIKQDDCKYTITQTYSDEKEFETYVRCFLEVVTRLDNMDEIREIYLKSREIVNSNPSPYEIKSLVKSLIKQAPSDLLGVQGRLRLDMERMYVVRPRKVDIDFKDAEHFVHFLFRNLILQRRWDRLRSQRIGTTFASGRKFRIIKVLSRLENPTNLLQIYDKEGEDQIKYTREAFTKNVRAFRRIGLLEAPEKIETIHTQRGTKFKDQIILVKAFYGEGVKMNIMSSRSPREIMSNLVIVTQHLQHLSKFLDRFGSGPLVGFLRRSKQRGQHSEVPEISIHNIDKINTNMFLKEKWAQKLVMSLHSECKMFWKEKFSSFA